MQFLPCGGIYELEYKNDRNFSTDQFLLIEVSVPDGFFQILEYSGYRPGTVALRRFEKVLDIDNLLDLARLWK